MAVDATRHLNTISMPTALAPADASIGQPIDEVWPKRGRRDELEALGLLLGVLSILLALAIGLGVTPGF
jgi:hypothetical protein